MKSDWQLTPLSEILTQSTEITEIEPQETYRQVTVKMWGQGVVLRGLTTGAEIATTRQFIAREGQFILSRIDSRNGAFGLIPPELDGAIVTNDFPLFNLNLYKVSPKYLSFMSKTGEFIDLCKAASEGTTNRVRLKVDRFLATEIPLPPLDEQRRIVAYIEDLATRIEEARGLRRGALEEAEAIINSEARRILKTIKSPPTPLTHWLDKSRDGIQTGPFGAQLGSHDFADSGVPLLTIGNIQYEGLDISNLKYVKPEKSTQLLRYSVKAGDILFARMGTVGRCCVVPSVSEGWLINYHIIRVALDKDLVEPRFIHWTIQASEDIENYLGENIRGATRQGVNSKIVGGLPCRIPNIDEQLSIVAHLDEMQVHAKELMDLQIETTAELNALLPSVLDKAFRGEL